MLKRLYKKKVIDISFKGMPESWLRIIVKVKYLFKLPNSFKQYLTHLIYVQKLNPKEWLDKPDILKIIKEYNLGKCYPLKTIPEVKKQWKLKDCSTLEESFCFGLKYWIKRLIKRKEYV